MAREGERERAQEEDEEEEEEAEVMDYQHTAPTCRYEEAYAAPLSRVNHCNLALQLHKFCPKGPGHTGATPCV